MMKLGFNCGRSLAEKAEEQQGTLPVAMELNERELAFVAGGLGYSDGNGYYDDYHHHRYYDHHYDHYHDHYYDHYHGHH